MVYVSPPSFIFHCDICHEQAMIKHSRDKIHTCLHCGALLCEKCETHGFCSTGFQNLPESMKIKIRQIDDALFKEFQMKTKVNNQKSFVGVLFCVIAAIGIIWKLPDNRNNLEFFFILFLWIFPPFIVGSIILYKTTFSIPDKQEIYFTGRPQKLKILHEDGNPVKKGYVVPADEFIKLKLKLIK